MGLCLDCFQGESSDYDQPDPETRRQQQAEAAVKRQHEIEGRGVKDPAALRRKQQRREELEKRSEQQNQGDGLRWQVG